VSELTKKIGSAGRFGARYGAKQKKVVAQLEKLKKESKVCPFCERKSLKRIAPGIWYCKKCKTKFAGGAYFPKT